MSSAPHVVPPDLLGQGRDSWNAWRGKNISVTYEFTANQVFEGQDFNGWNFKRIIFPNCDFGGCKLVGSSVEEAVFIKCLATNAELCAFDHAKLTHCHFSQAKFHNGVLSLRFAELEEGTFRSSRILRLDSTGARFSGTKFIDCEFNAISSESSLSQVVFRRCTFRRCRFHGVDLRGTKFEEGSLLENCDLTGAEVGDGTTFSGADLKNCTIDRYTLEMLSPEAVTRAQVRTLKIDDPFARMRVAFSGLMRNIHVMALLLFLAPYVVFVIENYIKSRFSAGRIPLYEKLYWFALTAGDFTTVKPSQICIITFLLIYNVLRGILVFKTNVLEMEHASTNAVPRFFLKGGWGAMFLAFEIGFFVNVSLVLFHTFRFMNVKVP